MNLGLKVILCAVAIILFVIAVFATERYPDLLALGLACLAAALAVEEAGLGRYSLGGPSARRDVR